MREQIVSYEVDFFAWAMAQGQLLREGRFDLADVANIIEELEGMARSVRRELRSHLVVLLTHLLKWQYQPAWRSKSWERTIKTQRREVLGNLREAPSLSPLLNDQEWLNSAWNLAVTRAVSETGMDLFPQQCPWRIEEDVLSSNWMP